MWHFNILKKGDATDVVPDISGSAKHSALWEGAVWLFTSIITALIWVCPPNFRSIQSGRHLEDAAVSIIVILAATIVAWHALSLLLVRLATLALLPEWVQALLRHLVALGGTPQARRLLARAALVAALGTAVPATAMAAPTRGFPHDVSTTITQTACNMRNTERGGSPPSGEHDEPFSGEQDETLSGKESDGDIPDDLSWSSTPLMAPDGPSPGQSSTESPYSDQQVAQENTSTKSTNKDSQFTENRSRDHIVTTNESLWSITAALLGSQSTEYDIARLWPELYRLNIDKIGPNPDLIVPHTELVLPLELQ